MRDARIRPVISRFPYIICRIWSNWESAYYRCLHNSNSTKGNTKYGNGLRIFVLIGNIMKMHDCRKRQIEIERQRSRKAAKQEKQKAKKTGKQNREKQEKQRSRKAGKKQNSGKAGKAYKQRTKEQTRRKAEK